MGPRNKRRLAIGGGICAVVVAIAVSALLTRSSTPSRNAARSSALSGDATAAHFELSPPATYKMLYGMYGMNGKQVRDLVGRPASERGRCWLYRTTPDPRSAATGVVETDVSVCFFEGRVSDTSSTDYIQLRGKLLAVPKPKSIPG